MRIYFFIPVFTLTFGIGLGLALVTPSVLAKASNSAQTTAMQPGAANPAVQSTADGSGLVAPQLEGRAWILYDMSAQQVLTEKDPDMIVEPASLTKLMTAYLVFEALKDKKITLTQTLPISQNAWSKEGSRMFVPAGAQIPVEDLIKGMIVQSGNDATNALAEGLGGGSTTPFVGQMNAKAKALGMHQTQFRNPEGLTAEGHTSTVRDLLTLSRRLMQDYPDRVAYYAIKNYAYAGTPTSNSGNRNLLLFRDPSVDGLKTGHTEKAGFNLIATAKREVAGMGSRRLISVVVGTKSEAARANESQKLLNWGYAAFDMLKFAEAKQVLKSERVWMGAENEVKLGLESPLWVAIPKGKQAQTTSVVTPIGKQLFAPLIQGQDLGAIEVKVDQKPYLKIPLHVLDEVPEAGFFGQLWDRAHLWIAGHLSKTLGIY